MDNSGNSVAKYEYNPFGKQTLCSGSYAESNPFRFSSEYYEFETGLVYYNFRYYNPELGRWMSRDPIEERGGYNLYGIVNNNLVDGWDNLGLEGTAEVSVGDQGVNTPGELNCLGHAAGVGDLQPNEGSTIEGLVSELGWSCSPNISAKDCKCHCGEGKEFMMVYVYTIPTDKDKIDVIREGFKGRDPLISKIRGKEDKWGKYGDIDFHAIKGIGGSCDYPNYTSQNGRTRNNGGHTDITPINPTTDKPDFFPKNRILSKMCCCK
jgi:RHS repeat-associated protein